MKFGVQIFFYGETTSVFGTKTQSSRVCRPETMSIRDENCFWVLTTVVMRMRMFSRAALSIPSSETVFSTERMLNIPHGSNIHKHWFHVFNDTLRFLNWRVVRRIWRRPRSKSPCPCLLWSSDSEQSDDGAVGSRMMWRVFFFFF